MSGRLIFTGFLIVFLLGVAIVWFINRPTPQEATLKRFFNELRRGNADKASEYLLDNSYGKFILASEVTDSDGYDLKEGTHGWGVDVEALDKIARRNIPYVRGRVQKLEFTNLKTQRVETDKDKAYVIFEVAFNIKEQFDLPSIPGFCSGTAEMHRVDGKWVIVSGIFHFHIQGRSIKNYTSYY